MIPFKTFFIIAISIAVTKAASTGSFVVSSEESTNKEQNEKNSPESKKPEIYEMNIRTNVTNRFAKTLITSRVKNTELQAKETTFLVILPEKAFISEFIMEIDGKSYKAYVKEKEEAKNIYNKAVSSGQSAAHVAVSARDSNKFTVSLNIEPESKAVFKLIYEELLERQRGKYEVVLNIHPGQIVPKLEVEVAIDETAPLSFVKTPSLRTGNEISKEVDGLKPNAEIVKINDTSSIVKFHPDVNQQVKFAKALDVKESEGIKGQFVVEYDVKRDSTGGEILVNDGYFVHFFAPEILETLPTRVVFVLDISGSMMGRKMDQLIDAMVNILDNLRPQDSFSIVTFSTSVYVWNIASNNSIDLNLGYNSKYGELEKELKEKEIPGPVKTTVENIAAAKLFVKSISSLSLTNIMGGLEVGLHILKRIPKDSDFQQPLIIFLTDGQATSGIISDDGIISTISKLNPKEKQIPIFSLSFGSGADKNFLRKLSSKNMGFSRHIYEAADSSIQLQDFYQLVSSPLIKDVTFKYTKNASLTTKNRFPIFFKGSEFIVAGKIEADTGGEYIVEGWRPTGIVEMKPKVIEPIDSLERLWAFLQVRQILNERDVSDNKTELTKKAVDLALKYSFVTPVTSLVVVKPNNTLQDGDVDAADTTQSGDTLPAANYYLSMRSFPRFGGGGFHPVSYDASSRSRLRFRSRTLRPSYTYNTPPTTTTTIITTTRTKYSDALQQISPAPIPELKSQSWFNAILLNDFTIQVDTAYYKLATNETSVANKTCAKTMTNKVGTCTLIHKCPQSISYLTDLSKFKEIFCPLEGYAGICCDVQLVE